MTVIRADQPHTRSIFAQWVQDAAQIVGERVIACEMWNSQNAPASLPRCEYCYDDVYAQSDTTTGVCSHCFGTSYKGGIALAHFTSAIIGAPQTSSLYDQKNGELDIDTVKAQFSADVQLHEKDYVLRVHSWDVSNDGLMPVDADVWQVAANFSDSYLKDGFRDIGESHRVGAQLTLSQVTQNNPIRNIIFNGMSADLVTDAQPFVVYSEQYPIFDWAKKWNKQIKTVGEVAEISVQDYSNYRVAHFR